MMKKISIVGAAVVAALCAAPSMALTPDLANETTPGVVKLVVSGSSAFQSAFETELNSASSSVCQSGTYNKYVATVDSGTAPGIAAYTCTSVVSLFGSAKPTIIYYRSEGGSIYGLTPVVRPAAQILRLGVTTGCVAATAPNYNCRVGVSYNAVADTVNTPTANAVNGSPDMGLADEEASMFIGSNYPSAATSTKLQPGLSATEIATLNANSTPLVLQSFGVYTHVQSASPTADDLALNNLGSLSRQVIADIFRGKWQNWNQVPKNDGSNTTVVSGDLPIVVCRREAGSGTQVAASVFFHRTNCGGADEFVYQGGENNVDPGKVIENTSTGNMRSCLSGNKGAIGFISAEADRAGLQMIQVDGKGSPITETANNLGVVTASGDYGYAFELVAVKRQGLSGDPATLANALISKAQGQASGPTSPNVTFLPVGTNATITTFPLNTTTNPGKQPISCFTRGGNSCAELADQC